ncbi:DNA-depenent RNA polymerase largest subunit [Lymphocystis disease virus 1]|uniref:DNA-depenent RNA polymerase largest subunit n=1 Tax=Fish lymphocystis disease virus TaxID=36363 RepID=UPI0000161E9E|nr:DNA-depenent RNA polymerase largest subunit [Lymphocystis disease virus 1]
MDLTSFNFSLSSDDIILKNSVTEINKCCLKQEKQSIYDPYLGGIEGLCPTCTKDSYQCPGHFGHINLAIPILIFYKEAVNILKKHCLNCGLNTLSSPCENCSVVHPSIKLTENEIGLSKIQLKHKDKKIELLEPDKIKLIFEKITAPAHIHPTNLILTKFPVLPPCCRPQTPLVDDDLSVFLSQIVKLNNKLKLNYCPQVADQLRLKILCYVDNTKGKATHNTNHKAMTGIKERLSKKTGILRQNMMGKRRNQTARSVVGPDTTLKLDEVAIPYEIANNLTIPIKITPFNYKLISSYKIAAVIKANGAKYCIPTDRQKYVLIHGDSIACSKNGQEFMVTDCNAVVPDNFEPIKKLVPFPLPTIEIGDTIERFLEDGDPVILNRQPTLHRNSMLGMKIVKKLGKTIRVNLAVTHGFNMDFDGDEGNLYLPQSEEARFEVAELMNPKKLIISNKYPQAEIFPVQDAVLGAYLMTKYPNMTQEEYFDCLTALDLFYKPVKQYTTINLIKLLLPNDFCLDLTSLTIVNGQIITGFLTGKTLKIIVQYLALEYPCEQVVYFIDQIQSLTNKWLLNHPFSVGIKDCVELKCETHTIIKNYYIKANKAYNEAPFFYKETAVGIVLNSVKDAATKIIKTDENNAFVVMANAGSKGDCFNLVQIGGLLGQQYVNGQRPGYETDDDRKTLACYPRIVTDLIDKYESRGFVSSCFINGLNPRECFFHAKSGREGMINTSQTTGVTGYAERRMVKLTENIIIAYDGSVRDAKNNIVQFIYGNHGMNPAKCFKTGIPLCFKRLAYKLNLNYTGPLTIPNYNNILELIFFKQLPEPIQEYVLQFHRNNIKAGAVLIPKSACQIWTETVRKAYVAAIIDPGEAVGIICAQAIGAKQTQQTLNTFHKAGTLSEAGHRQFGEILSLTQKPKKRSCYLKLKNVPSNPTEIRDLLGCSLICKPLTDCSEPGAFKVTYLKTKTILEIKLNIDVCFKHRISPDDIISAAVQKFEAPYFCLASTFDSILLSWSTHCCIDKIFKDVLKLKIGPVQGVTGYDLYPIPHTKPIEYAIVTKGSNLQKLLSHPHIKTEGAICDDVWDIYKTLGLAAVRKRLREMIKTCVGEEIYPEHIQLLVDQMTYKGKPMPIDRYTMRTHQVGPLSRAAFEESLDILVNSAVIGETDTLNGVSACVIAGKKTFIGTGFPKLIYDPTYLKSATLV